MNQMNVKGKALVLTNGMLDTDSAKTCHGLLRGSERFKVAGVIDTKHAGKDAGKVMDGYELGVPIVENVEAFFEANPNADVQFCVVGVALPGGKLPEPMIVDLLSAVERGMSLVSGLHSYLSEIPEIFTAAQRKRVDLIDIRKPKSIKDLHFWSGKIYDVNAARIAVLGMDCGIGKRTTCRFIMESCRAHGIYAEMIYTGQTGWMQGYPYGFIFDSTLNDFVSGELEHSIVNCDKELNPDLILLEGQSALRNPSGPCGSEMILSGDAKGIILVHAPDRMFYKHTTTPMSNVESEIELIKFYGAEVLGVALNEGSADHQFLEDYKKELSSSLDIPVVRPLVDGVADFMPAIKSFIDKKVPSVK
ncbi:MAG: DUF1611 domain-containing protein [Bacteroidota bacterium]